MSRLYSPWPRFRIRIMNKLGGTRDLSGVRILNTRGQRECRTLTEGQLNQRRWTDRVYRRSEDRRNELSAGKCPHYHAAVNFLI